MAAEKRSQQSGQHYARGMMDLKEIIMIDLIFQ